MSQKIAITLTAPDIETVLDALEWWILNMGQMIEDTASPDDEEEQSLLADLARMRDLEKRLKTELETVTVN
jgi:hypothetical protein